MSLGWIHLAFVISCRSISNEPYFNPPFFYLTLFYYGNSVLLSLILMTIVADLWRRNDAVSVIGGRRYLPPDAAARPSEHDGTARPLLHIFVTQHVLIGGSTERALVSWRLHPGLTERMPLRQRSASPSLLHNPKTLEESSKEIQSGPRPGMKSFRWSQRIP